MHMDRAAQAGAARAPVERGEGGGDLAALCQCQLVGKGEAVDGAPLGQGVARGGQRRKLSGCGAQH